MSTVCQAERQEQTSLPTATPERHYVQPGDSILPGENHLVTLRLSTGEVLEGLEPRCLFPVSCADRYVTLLDAEGRECALIRALCELDADSARVVRASLEDYYLVPRILRILSSSERSGTLRWTVETDRGVHSFDIRNRNHDIRVYPDGRVRVRDSDDNRYLIENYRALDAHSRMRMIAEL